MKNYFSLLDGVRFFAAFWVMNFHYLFRLEESSDLHWYRFGNLGVQLFFIISGFVIVQSLKNKTWKEFVSNRFIRLFPLFWILCTLTYLVTLAVPGANPLHFIEYVVSMTMFGDTINEFNHNALRLIDPSYWTLTVELIFYILIGAFTFIVSYKHIRYFLLGWLAFSIFAFAYHFDQDFYYKVLLVRHASYFVFGGALSLLASHQAKHLFEKCIDYLLLVGSAVYSIYIHPRALPPYLHQNAYDGYIVSGLLAVFFIGSILLIYMSHRVKNPRTITILAICGGLTYPLYLLHQTIGDTVLNYVVNHYYYSWNYVALAFEIVIIGIAYVVFIQEKKMRAWLKRRL